MRFQDLILSSYAHKNVPGFWVLTSYLELPGWLFQLLSLCVFNRSPADVVSASSVAVWLWCLCWAELLEWPQWPSSALSRYCSQVLCWQQCNLLLLALALSITVLLDSAHIHLKHTWAFLNTGANCGFTNKIRRTNTRRHRGSYLVWRGLLSAQLVRLVHTHNQDLGSVTKWETSSQLLDFTYCPL